MEAVPKDWGQTQRPQRDRKENIIKPWMSDLQFRTYGEKKKKEKGFRSTKNCSMLAWVGV